jgi:hypothetical protein
MAAVHAMAVAKVCVPPAIDAARIAEYVFVPVAWRFVIVLANHRAKAARRCGDRAEYKYNYKLHLYSAERQALAFFWHRYSCGRVRCGQALVA